MVLYLIHLNIKLLTLAWDMNCPVDIRKSLYYLIFFDKKGSKVIYLGMSFLCGLYWFSHILLIWKKGFHMTYHIKRLHTFGITRHLLLLFVNSWIVSIILHCSLLFFLALLRRDFPVLHWVMKGCGESFKVIINMVMDRHLKFCKLLAHVILSNTNHPLHSHLSPYIPSGRTRHRYIKIDTRKQRYKSSTTPHLANIRCDVHVVITD